MFAMSTISANVKPSWAKGLAALVCSVLVACSQGDDPEPPPPSEGSATLNAAGGTLAGPDGVQLVVPADSLDTPVTFRVSRDATGAPALIGLNAVSPIYAVTPHGQAFGTGALFSIPMSAAQLPEGATPILLKAEPGGTWRVMRNASSDPTRMAADIDGLSFFVIGTCSAVPTLGFTIGAIGCPSNHELRLTMFDGQNVPVQILRGPNGVRLPLWYVTDTPQTRTFRVEWVRPTSSRVDQVSVLGSNGGFTPNPASATSNFSQTFSVTIDPSQIGGANAPNGVIRRVTAVADYTTTAFQVGLGNVPTGFQFVTDIPILVRFNGALPSITQQPSNVGVNDGQAASFTVVATGGTLTYQWSRRPNASASFADITGATAASYAIAAAQLADDGAQFRVQVCLAPTRCVTSNPATLNVTQAPVVPAFSAHPADIAVVAGQTASFSATATGMPLPQLKWQSAAPGSSTFSDVTGVAACGTTNPPGSGSSVTANCIVGPLTVGDSGQRYRAVAINAASAGGVTSNAATLTVAAAPVAPVITQQPAAQSTSVGGSATFSVTATGTAPLNYAWGTLNGGVLPSMTGNFTIGSCSGQITYSNGGATLTLSNLTLFCSGFTVTVTVSNGVNPNAVSNGVTLTVNPTSNTWLVQNSGANNLLESVATWDGNIAWAVGSAGWITRTTNGGANWIAQQMPGVSVLSSVSAATPNVIWAVGGDAILHSRDGGITWVAQSGAAGEYLYAVSAVDSVNAWAVGFNGVILRNSGVGWVTQVAATGPFETLTSVAQVDSSTAWASGNRRILKTVDGGANWVQQTPGVVNYGGVVVASSGGSTAWVTAQGGVLRTVNGGTTWTLETLPGGVSPNVLVQSGNTLWAFTQGLAAKAYRSTGGGVTGTWTAETPITPSHVHMRGFAAFTPNLIWAVGDGGIIVKH